MEIKGQGVVTFLVGPKKHILPVTAALLSVSKNWFGPITVGVDEWFDTACLRHWNELNLHVDIIPLKGLPSADSQKVQWCRQNLLNISPYLDSLVLDSYCIALKPLACLFDFAHGFDVTACREYCRTLSRAVARDRLGLWEKPPSDYCHPTTKMRSFEFPEDAPWLRKSLMVVNNNEQTRQLFAVRDNPYWLEANFKRLGIKWFELPDIVCDRRLVINQHDQIVEESQTWNDNAVTVWKPGWGGRNVLATHHPEMLEIAERMTLDLQLKNVPKHRF
jgi:hypothetical protein